MPKSAAQFSNAARHVLELADREAVAFNHEYIGTEHLLLGVIEDRTGRASQVLESFRVEPRSIRSAIEMVIRKGYAPVGIDTLPGTPRAKQVLGYSVEEATRFGGCVV